MCIRDRRSVPEIKKINKFLRVVLIIEAHEQKYTYSCIPSAIEMILKLLGKVDISFYDLQNNWGNKSDGSFGDFNGKTIRGLTFERKFAVPRSSNFPTEELFRVIDEELASDRYVIISLPVKNRWHMYVIYTKTDDDYHAFSKSGKKTIFLDNLKPIIYKIQGTDILIYKTQ